MTPSVQSLQVAVFFVALLEHDEHPQFGDTLFVATLFQGREVD